MNKTEPLIARFFLIVQDKEPEYHWPYNQGGEDFVKVWTNTLSPTDRQTLIEEVEAWIRIKFDQMNLETDEIELNKKQNEVRDLCSGLSSIVGFDNNGFFLDLAEQLNVIKHERLQANLIILHGLHGAKIQPERLWALFDALLSVLSDPATPRKILPEIEEVIYRISCTSQADEAFAWALLDRIYHDETAARCLDRKKHLFATVRSLLSRVIHNEGITMTHLTETIIRVCEQDENIRHDLRSVIESYPSMLMDAPAELLLYAGGKDLLKKQKDHRREAEEEMKRQEKLWQDHLEHLKKKGIVWDFDKS